MARLCNRCAGLMTRQAVLAGAHRKYVLDADLLQALGDVKAQVGHRAGLAAWKCSDGSFCQSMGSAAYASNTAAHCTTIACLSELWNVPSESLTRGYQEKVAAEMKRDG